MRLPALLTASLLAAVSPARAEYCADQPWQALGAAYGHTRLPDQIEDQWVRCQALPRSPGQAAVALVYPAPGVAVPKNPGDPLPGYVAELLLVDTANGQVLSRQSSERTVQADGTVLTGVELDPEPLALAPRVRSVGLRLQHGGVVPEKLASRETLSLYAIEGTSLRRVVDGLTTWSVSGEWDTKCAGTFTETRTTVKTGPGAGKGFADLVLRRTQDHRTARLQGKACVDRKAAPVVRQTALRYDGQAYPVPAATP
jgi:hypothetical protein